METNLPSKNPVQLHTGTGITHATVELNIRQMQLLGDCACIIQERLAKPESADYPTDTELKLLPFLASFKNWAADINNIWGNFSSTNEEVNIESANSTSTEAEEPIKYEFIVQKYWLD